MENPENHGELPELVLMQKSLYGVKDWNKFSSCKHTRVEEPAKHLTL